MIYLIAGRTGAGKDYLVAKLIELSKQINGTPWKQVTRSLEIQASAGLGEK